MGQKLAEECKTIFDTASLSHGSLWGRVNVFLPEFKSLIVLLSKIFPDKAQLRHMKVNALCQVMCRFLPFFSSLRCSGKYEYMYPWLDIDIQMYSTNHVEYDDALIHIGPG